MHLTLSFSFTLSKIRRPNRQTANFRAIEKRILDGIIGEKYDSRIRPSGANFSSAGQGEWKTHLSLFSSFSSQLSLSHLFSSLPSTVLYSFCSLFHLFLLSFFLLFFSSFFCEGFLLNQYEGQWETTDRHMGRNREWEVSQEFHWRRETNTNTLIKRSKGFPSIFFRL